MGVCLIETVWLVLWWHVLGDEGPQHWHKRSTNISTNHQLERHNRKASPKMIALDQNCALGERCPPKLRAKSTSCELVHVVGRPSTIPRGSRPGSSAAGS